MYEIIVDLISLIMGGALAIAGFLVLKTWRHQQNAKYATEILFTAIEYREGFGSLIRDGFSRLEVFKAKAQTGAKKNSELSELDLIVLHTERWRKFSPLKKKLTQSYIMAEALDWRITSAKIQEMLKPAQAYHDTLQQKLFKDYQDKNTPNKTENSDKDWGCLLKELDATTEDVRIDMSKHIKPKKFIIF